MQYLDVRTLKGKIKPDAVKVKLQTGDKVQTLNIIYQKVGFGKKRFFVCPKCSKHIERVYITTGRWMCAKCSGVNPYYEIQNTTKGGTNEIQYRMKRYADQNGIKFDFPFDYTEFALDDRRCKKSFIKAIKVLQALENMRFGSNFLKARYKSKDFKAVLSGKHPLMQTTTLYDLRQNIYDWSKNELVSIPSGTVKDRLKGR